MPSQDFRNQDLANVSLCGKDLAYARFDNVNLENADLSDTILTCANFANANLYCANLSNTNLTGTRFDGANLDKSDLSNAYLGFTNCNNASIREACFDGACLMSTKLRGTNLLKSNLGDAWIYQTDLSLAVYEASNSLMTHQLLLDIEVSERETMSMQVLHARIQRRNWLQPEKREATVPIYMRDPNVVAYVRLRSEYRCEMCGWLGFVKDDGTQYVEVHHLKPLSETGQDTPENAVALCPNCHRHLHHGRDRKQALTQLIERLATKGIDVCPS